MKRQVLGMLLCGLALTARPAGAASITFEGEGKVGIVDVHSPNLGDVWTYAGELDWVWTGTSSSFYTYCVDVNDWLLDTQSVNVLSSSALTNPGVPDAGGKAAWLIDTYAPWIDAHGGGDDAAALQVAIWTALYDSGPSLNSGPFLLLSADSTISNEAQRYLSALYSAPGGGYYTANATWLDSPPAQGQDQMAPVPEPASFALLVIGLAGITMRFLWQGRLRAKRVVSIAHL